MNTLYEQAISGLMEDGYAVVENFLSEGLTGGLRGILKSQYSQGEFKKAGIGKLTGFQENPEIRSDYIHWLGDQSKQPVEQDFLNLVNDFVEYLNETCFTGIKGFEFHYALYPKGSFYKRHRDQFSNDDSRKYSLILNSTVMSRCYGRNWALVLEGYSRTKS